MNTNKKMFEFALNRMDFEKYIRSLAGNERTIFFDRYEDGQYKNLEMEERWQGWKAAKANTAAQLREVAIAVREAADKACWMPTDFDDWVRLKSAPECIEAIRALDIDSILKGK